MCVLCFVCAFVFCVCVFSYPSLPHGRRVQTTCRIHDNKKGLAPTVCYLSLCFQVKLDWYDTEDELVGTMVDNITNHRGCVAGIVFDSLDVATATASYKIRMDAVPGGYATFGTRYCGRLHNLHVCSIGWCPIGWCPVLGVLLHIAYVAADTPFPLGGEPCGGEPCGVLRPSL